MYVSFPFVTPKKMRKSSIAMGGRLVGMRHL